MGCGHSAFNCEAVCHGDLVPTMDPVDVGCVAWRATAGCDPNHGARLPGDDKICGETIGSSDSGYCYCANGDRAPPNYGDLGCAHETFTCTAVCEGGMPGTLPPSPGGASSVPTRAPTKSTPSPSGAPTSSAPSCGPSSTPSNAPTTTPGSDVTLAPTSAGSSGAATGQDAGGALLAPGAALGFLVAGGLVLIVAAAAALAGATHWRRQRAERGRLVRHRDSGIQLDATRYEGLNA